MIFSICLKHDFWAWQKSFRGPFFYKSQVGQRKMTSFNDGHYPIKKVFSGVFNGGDFEVVLALLNFQSCLKNRNKPNWSKYKVEVERGTHQFDLFCTSTALLRPLYFGSLTSTISQILIFYWSKSIDRSKVLVEVKSVDRSTEKVEDLKMVAVQKRSN